MSLQTHRAERADRLVGALGDLLSAPLDDPFASEVVSVPTPGVERWLSQGLSRRLGASPGRTDGVCAGIVFPSPRRLVAEALAAADPEGPESDPWQPQRAVWPLLRVIEACRDESWAGVLWSYLGVRSGQPYDEIRGGLRWSTARRLAGLFARYAAARPAMLRAWSEGRDVDPAEHPLTPDRAWQAELWRRLRAELGGRGPTERLQTGVAALVREPGLSTLPDRLSVFGATRLDADHLQVLAALAEHRDVHLWLPHPSPVLWATVAAAAPTTGRGPRAADQTGGLVRHRLLAYLGRDSRELQLCIEAAGSTVRDTHHEAPAPLAGPTLLARLQADLTSNRPALPEAERPVLDAEDRSITFHASHGPDRQVEVLREALVGLLADDPTLEPRDIVVMCPDIETFAPLIAAAFGLDTAETSAEHPGHRLRVRLADRSLRQLNPLLGLVSRLVALAGSRVEASAVLDICAAPPVARKFSFSTDDLERLQDLVARSGVRWGLDATHRARFGMGEFGQNTWAAGLDRLLLGVTMDETDQHFIGTALPLDDVDSGDVDLVGRLGECVGRIRFVTDACQQARSVTDWVALFRQSLDQLAEVSATDSWQLGHAYAELGGLAEAGRTDAGEQVTELSLPEVSALLADAFRGRASRANFRTGTLTMCTMLPMRSVPHRVVCLLGVDDGVFPRHGRLDGDDITGLVEWVGDRDPRSEDRQLLLDAVLAAEDRLLVVYAGRDPRTGVDTPPAVPIGELLDAVDLTARTPDGTPVRTRITICHPLQPFDQANFVPSVSGSAFSFDRAGLRGVRASTRQRAAGPPVFTTTGLSPLPPDRVVTLSDLIRFFNHPVRALLRDRAGLSVWREEQGPDEQIPASLAGLDRWAVGDRMLRLHLLGQDLEALQAAEWRRGSLPPRSFGQQALTGIVSDVAELAGAARSFLAEPVGRQEVLADLGPVRLTGLVAGLRGDTLLRVSFSRISAKHRLQAWLELLALTVSHPDQPWQAVTIGRGGRSTVGPVQSGWAEMVLADLVELQRVGLGEALPFAARTSAEYARIRYEDRPVALFTQALERLWRDDRDEAYERFFGVQAGLEVLMSEPSRAEEERGRLAEPSRFGTLARRVFHPMLSAEAGS